MKTLEEALQAAVDEVNSWPAWKRNLARYGTVNPKVVQSKSRSNCNLSGASPREERLSVFTNRLTPGEQY